MAVPTRPVQDGIIDPVWGQWVHDDTLRTQQMRFHTFIGAVFDSNGLFFMDAATFGLQTIDGLVWNFFFANFNPTDQPGQLIPGFVYRVNASRVLVVGHVYQHPNGTMSRIGGGVVDIYAMAWGTPV